MLNSESISGAMGLQRRNNFIPDQITKPVQEKDLDVLEDFSSPEHLLQVCFTRSTTAVGLRTAILTFTLYPRRIPAHKEKLTAGGSDRNLESVCQPPPEALDVSWAL